MSGISENNFWFILTAAAVVLLVGGMVWFSPATPPQKEPSNLTEELNTADLPTPPFSPSVHSASPMSPLQIVSPNSGETICLGQDKVVRWDVSGAVRTVRLWVRQGKSGTAYEIGTSPAELNEEGKPGYGIMVWRAGEASGLALDVNVAGQIQTDPALWVLGRFPITRLPEGAGYEIGISDMENLDNYDVIDAPFSIIRCEG